MKKALTFGVVYERTLLRSQRDRSLANQERINSEFAKANGFRVIGNFYGMRAEKELFASELITSFTEALKQHEVHAVIISKIDWVFKSLVDNHKFMSLLTENNVELISVHEGVLKPGLLTNVLVAFAQYKHNKEGK